MKTCAILLALLGPSLQAANSVESDFVAGLACNRAEAFCKLLAAEEPWTNEQLDRILGRLSGFDQNEAKALEAALGGPQRFTKIDVSRLQARPDAQLPAGRALFVLSLDAKQGRAFTDMENDLDILRELEDWEWMYYPDLSVSFSGFVSQMKVEFFSLHKFRISVERARITWMIVDWGDKDERWEGTLEDIRDKVQKKVRAALRD